MFNWEGDEFWSGYDKTTPFVNTAYSVVTESLNGEYSFDFSNQVKSSSAIDHTFAHSRPGLKKSGNEVSLIADTHQYMPIGTWTFDVTNFNSAYEIGVKMKSLAGIYDALGKKFDPKDEPTCKSINEKIYAQVLANFNDTA